MCSSSSTKSIAISWQGRSKGERAGSKCFYRLQNKNSREPDLPLDTPEQIRHSLEVDAARESRAAVRKTEGEAGAIEIAKKRRASR